MALPICSGRMAFWRKACETRIHRLAQHAVGAPERIRFYRLWELLKLVPLLASSRGLLREYRPWVEVEVEVEVGG